MVREFRRHGFQGKARKLDACSWCILYRLVLLASLGVQVCQEAMAKWRRGVRITAELDRRCQIDIDTLGMEGTSASMQKGETGCCRLQGIRM